MIGSYLTAAARNFKKNKVHTLINITGLSLGMMASVLAIMFVMDEKSFDQFHSNKDRLYRLNKVFIQEDGSSQLNAESSGLIGPTMVEEFPEVEKVVRFHPWYEEVLLSRDEKNFIASEADLAFADSTFFEVFDFKLVSGNPRTVLKRPSTIVITESVAKSLFGQQDPIGKTIIGLAGVPFEVTGIVEEPPRNSHIQFKGLISWTTTVPNVGPEKLQFEWMNNWIAQGIRTYVLLKKDADVNQVHEKIPKFMQTHMPTRFDRYKPYLQPFQDLYLKSDDVKFGNLAKVGSQQFVNLFSIIAAFVLFIACINYINISTSKSTRRSREVGMRKTMGASKSQLVTQFLGESFLVTVLSAVVALGLVYLMTPFFNELAGKSLPLSLLMNSTVIGGVIALILLVSLVSGIYPSFIISSFSPAEVLRASGKSKVSGNWPRYVLITFQFSVSIIMIAGTLLVYQQIQFILSKDLGFDKEHILVIDLTDDMVAKKEVFQQEVDKLPGVVSTSVGRTALGQGSSSTYMIPEGFNPDEVEVRMFPADCNFLKTYGLEMAEGHFFDPNSASDSTSFIINEAMAKRLGWTDPLTKTIKFDVGEPAQPVIGVLKDFNFSSLYQEVEPLVMWLSKRRPGNMSVRFSGNPATLISSMEAKWKSIDARNPFNYLFLDQAYAKTYESEGKLFKTVMTFAALSIVIACLGLYGLVSYTIEQRTKEFGIRKVLGASVSSLSFLVNQKFIVMVLISAVVAIPIVLPMIEKWLQKFAFKIQVGPGVFIVSVLITLTVTIIAVSVHAIKIARANPAESLRQE
jgi:putative ABC transport system permease protein